MAEQGSDSIQVRCGGCRAQFRLTPRRTGVALTELPCPACKATIFVPPYPVANQRETVSRENMMPAASVPDGDGPGWARVSLGSMFNRADIESSAPVKPAAVAQPTALQNRFRPIAADENISDGPVQPIGNLGVFGQVFSGGKANRGVVFEEPPEPGDTFAIGPAVPATELVRNAKRLPETDKPDDVHPLAAVLLKQLREKRLPAPAAHSVGASRSALTSASEILPETDPLAGFDALFDDVFELDELDNESEVEHEVESVSSELAPPPFSAAARVEVVTPVINPVVILKPEAEREPLVVIDEPPVVLSVRKAEAGVSKPVVAELVLASPEVETSVEERVVTSKKRFQPRMGVFIGLVVATGIASALAVHVYHSNTRAVVTGEEVPVSFAIREPAEVNLSELRSLWSAIAVASETVIASTDQTARQKILGMIESGMSERAQKLILEEVKKHGVTPESQALFDMNLRADPRLDYEVITVAPNEDVSVAVDDQVERGQHITSIDEVRALGGGHSVSFRMTRGGESLYAFKPTQRVWVDGWRTEVAAYYLCFVMVCHFDVPENRAGRISRSVFETMYGQIHTDKQRNYADRFDELIWSSETGEDGAETEYLYGTLKAWIPRFALWPIEYEDVWHPWVDHRADPALLDVPFEEAIESLKTRPDRRLFAGIVGEQADVTTRSIARQVSSLLVFDYLTNNHDRYSTVEDYYGVNNHFVDGRFMSIDNGAAFQFQAMQKIQTRFEPVTRFSRSTIDSIRLMRPEAVDEILFPDMLSAEKLRLDVFWQQRKRLLARVDALIKEHGEDAILFFE